MRKEEARENSRIRCYGENFIPHRVVRWVKQDSIKKAGRREKKPVRSDEL